MLFVYLGLMFYYNAELTLVMLIFVPLSAGPHADLHGRF